MFGVFRKSNGFVERLRKLFCKKHLFFVKFSHCVVIMPLIND